MASRLHLIVNMHSSGAHPGAWRRPGANPRAFVDLDFYRAIAREAERGLFDSLFLADFSALQPETTYQPRWTMDPLVTMSALVGATEHIGLVSSISSTLTPPYQVARAIASIDHVSGGRAGWNVVTSFDPNAARNYGLRDLPEKRERYRRAEEHIRVVRALWASWEEQALVLDREAGVFADLDRIHPIDHHGEFYDVAGPLQLPRPPQGQPVLFQAGASEGGRVVASRYADGVFTSQLTVGSAVAYRDDLRRRAAAEGRSPDDIKVFPGIVVVAGADRNEALARRRALDDLPGGRNARIVQMQKSLGLALTDIDFDARPSQSLLAQAAERAKDHTTFADNLLKFFADPDKTWSDFFNSSSTGHRTLIGGPQEIADSFEQWLDAGAADGFVLMFDALPDGLRDFVDLVVPELQRRGLYRRAYEPSLTLAGRLGLRRETAVLQRADDATSATSATA